MKTSRGIAVASVSASLLATGWAAGAGFIKHTDTTALSAAIDTSSLTSSATVSPAESPSPQTTPPASTTAEPSAAAPEPSSEPAPAGATGTFAGATVQTRYGDFQVELSIADGVVTGASMLKSGESRGESQQINARALPILLDAVVREQRSAVGYVSGASYSSQAVIASAATALQAAGLE